MPYVDHVIMYSIDCVYRKTSELPHLLWEEERYETATFAMSQTCCLETNRLILVKFSIDVNNTIKRGTIKAIFANFSDASSTNMTIYPLCLCFMYGD